MSATERELRVTDVAERHRFEITVDGTAAGFAEYVARPDRLVFTHTVIQPAFEGQGVGSRLARESLDVVRERGLLATPKCSFYVRFFDRHPEYHDLLAP